LTPIKVAFFTTFLDLLGFGIIIPIQPFYAESFGASPAIVTLLGASYSLMQFLLSGQIGKISDRIGRRPVLLSSVALIIIGYVAFAQATTLTGLFIARMISGIGGANLGAAQAIIADVTPPDQRSRGMGVIGAAFGLGFIFGPAIGGWLGQWGPVYPIYFAAILSVLNWLFIFFWLPETLKPEEATSPIDRQVLASQSKWAILKLVNIPQLLGLSFLFTMSFALMEQTIGLFIERAWLSEVIDVKTRHSEAAALTAYFLVAVGVGASIVQGGLIGKLTARWGEVRLCQIGVVTVAITFLAIPSVGAGAPFSIMMLIGLLMATGTGMLHPSRNSLLSQGVPARQQGRALGLNQSISALGRVIGPASAGLLFEQGINLPFWIGGSVIMASWLLTLRLKHPSVLP
jgi:MFS transporter, DHA1 family, tetracycline resistance protein